jgi:hypothetical protein
MTDQPAPTPPPNVELKHDLDIQFTLTLRHHDGTTTKIAGSSGGAAPLQIEGPVLPGDLRAAGEILEIFADTRRAVAKCTSHIGSHAIVSNILNRWGIKGR